MSTVIAVTSGKGGTGKTTVTAGVASALSRLRRRVLCIDMDIGLRNLDISLGLSDRALMDFSDVLAGRCSLERAVVSRPDLPGLFLLTAPLSLEETVTQAQMKTLLSRAREDYDYVFLDSAAGLGSAFRLACGSADRVIVVSTSDASSLRDAQRTVAALRQQTVHLVVNRVQPKLLKKLRVTIDDAMDTAGLPLLGVVPEDPNVMLAANTGKPLILFEEKGAATACGNIARRLLGRRTPIMRIR